MSRSSSRKPRLFLICAPNRDSLIAKLGALRAERDDILMAFRNPRVSERVEGELCLAVIAQSAESLRKKLERSAELLADPQRKRIRDRAGLYFESEPLSRSGKIGVLFPGEGSEYDGALGELKQTRKDLAHFFSPGDIASAVSPMAAAVTKVLGADLAIWQVLREIGLRPDAFVGHSTGEFVSLAASGMIDVAADGEFIRFLDDLAVAALPAGAKVKPVVLLAIGADAETTHGLLSGLTGVGIGMENCSHQTVVIADRISAETVVGRASGRGILYERMQLDRPYHTELFRENAEALRSVYEKWITREQQIPTYTCCTATLFPDVVDDARVVATEQWVRPVLFRQTIEKMYADGVRIFVESGMRGNLTAFVSDVLRGRPHIAVAADIPSRGTHEQLLHLVAQLSANGVALQPDALEPAHDEIEQKSKRLPSAEVMKAHLEYMSSFFSVQEAVMRAYLKRRRESESESRSEERSSAPVEDAVVEIAAALPFIGTIVSHTPRKSLVAVRDFVVSEDLYIRDHTFGRDVSAADPGLMGLPVLPLTVSIEVMAEAASLLRPGMQVVELRDIRARRWITQESGHFSLRVEAVEGPDANTCTVKLFQHRDEKQPNAPWLLSPLSELVVVFATRRVPAPFRELASPPRAAETITGDEIYRDVMFHGAAFRGIQSVDRIGETACEANVEVLSRSGLLRSDPNPGFITDPILIDQIGQVLSTWLRYAGLRVPNAFPATISSIELFAPPLDAGQIVQCTVGRCVDVANELRCDAEVTDADGSVIVRVRDWHARQFDLPTPFVRTWPVANGLAMSTPFAQVSDLLPGEAHAHAALIRMDMFPDQFFQRHREIWLSALVHTVLGARERERWATLPYPAERRIQWLLGRVAAKDAARWYMNARNGAMVRPADIELIGGDGAPISVIVHGASGHEMAPHVSISHTDGIVIAIAASPDVSSGIGVDVETREHINEDVIDAGLSAVEQVLLSQSPEEDRTVAALRMWCAKESVVKAASAVGDASLSKFIVTAVHDDGSFEIESDDPVRKADIAFHVHTYLEGNACFAAALNRSSESSLTGTR